MSETAKEIKQITKGKMGIPPGAKAIGWGFKLLGRVSRTKTGETDKGEFLRLKGAFEAHPFNANGETLGVYTSRTAILPRVAEDEIAEALAEARDAQKEGDIPASIRFAIEVKMVEADSAMGCEWVCNHLADVSSGEDQFADLREIARLPRPDSARKALPAPAKKGDKKKKK
jgi:hypothetical protein